MQAENPGHVIINTRKVKVQRWQQLPDRTLISLLVHGDQGGGEITKHLEGDSVSLEVEGSPAVDVRPELTVHQVVGSGPTSVHRIEATLWLPESESTEQSIEARLDRIQLEMKQLWEEIAELKSQQLPTPRPKPTGLRQNLMAGQTMIESEIDMDDIDEQ